jgi:hypothetical protein
MACMCHDGKTGHGTRQIIPTKRSVGSGQWSACTQYLSTCVAASDDGGPAAA